MREKVKLGLLIFVYLAVGFLFYILTHENKTLFLIYKLAYSILTLFVMYVAYVYIRRKYS